MQPELSAGYPARASSRGSATRTAQSSGPRSAPVSAARSARRSPPTALSSLTIAFAASLSRSSGAAARSSREAPERLRRGGRAGMRAAAGAARRPTRPRPGRGRPEGPARTARARRRGPRAPRRRGRRAPRPRAAAAATRRSGRRRAEARAPRDRPAPPRAGSPARAGPPRRPPAPASRACGRRRPTRRPWWTYSGGSAPSARAIDCWSGVLGSRSLPRITCVMPRSRSSTTEASWYVGRPSARTSVARSKRSAPSSSGVPICLRCLDVPLGPLALPYRALVPRDAEPLQLAEDLLLGAGDLAGHVRVVDPQDEDAAVLVGEGAVGDGRERPADVQRPCRARCEAHPDHAG